MNQDRFRQIDELFDEVLDLEPSARNDYLKKVCGTDSELFHELQILVKATEASVDFIETKDFIPAKHFLDEAQKDNLIGKKIGAYQLEKLLGRGGMGAVYLATRIDDFEKQVAVKIIPPFENRRSSAENFRRERQILARLSHPFIAQILDGGTTDANTPFIVMEYVDGLPLNQFCREKNLKVREKLRLFQQVCAAVSFAHQNLVVHRDLKPNNILVCDDRTPKLLDFGIAKMLDANAFGIAENKTFDGNALTLEYASPEQINGENITVASDVYSLGVILYELLTDQRPHNFKQKSLAEILKIIQTNEPLAPSKIVNLKSETSDSELDAIVLKSLAKSTNERYKSVAEFSRDIENYLNYLPISARPKTNFYRFKKYVRRHRLESAITLLVSFLIIGWLITFVWQIRKEQIQARENRRAAYSAEMILAANEYENANLNRLKELVEKYKPEKDAEDLRGFEWYFLNNLLNPPTKIASFTHNDEVWNAEFSPDGKFIASACNDNRARIWDTENGQMIETAEQKGAWKVSFFPDGKRFAVSSSSNSNPAVKIYETATAKEVFALKGHTKRVRALDISPDGKLIATGSADGNIIIWNAENGAELRKFEFATAQKNLEFQDVQFSKAGDKLAVLGFDTLAIFDTKTWRKIEADSNKFLDKNIALSGWKVAFSPLGKTIAIGTFTGDVAFIDTESLEILKVLKLHQANVKSLAFSSDGKILATGSWDRTAKFVDVQTGEILNELRGHFAGIHEIFFSPDGTKLATASADFNLNLWNAAEVSKANALLTNGNYMAFSPDAENLFTWSNTENSFSKWNLAEKKSVWKNNSAVNAFSIDFSSETNRLAFGERDGVISIFDAENGKLIITKKKHDKTVFALKFATDGKRIFAVYEDGLLKSFDAENLSEIFSVKAHSDIVKALDISPDGKFLVTGSNDKSVKIFDAETGKELQILNESTKPLYKTIFSSEGNLLVTTGADDVARIWRTFDRKLLHELSGMSAGIFAAAFSPDGKRLATASDVGIIRLWNTETGEQVLAFTASQRQIVNLKFTPDGKILISVDSTGKVSFWQSSGL